MVGLYLFGLLAGLVVTSLVSRLSPSKDDDLPFVLEMPPYRVPAWGPLLQTALRRSKDFVTKAGAVIFAVTVVVWVLGYFPNGGEDPRRFLARRPRPLDRAPLCAPGPRLALRRGHPHIFPLPGKSS